MRFGTASLSKERGDGVKSTWGCRFVGAGACIRSSAWYNEGMNNTEITKTVALTPAVSLTVTVSYKGHGLDWDTQAKLVKNGRQVFAGQALDALGKLSPEPRKIARKALDEATGELFRACPELANAHHDDQADDRLFARMAAQNGVDAPHYTLSRNTVRS